MKAPLTLFSLIPSNMLGFFVRYTLALEDWSNFEAALLGTALVAALLSIPITVRMARVFGKAHGLAYMLAFESVAFLVFCCLPYSFYRDNLWFSFVVAFVLGAGTTLAFGLPDAILNDIIDYDELRTGERNEGLYTVVETNLQQFVEIAGGVIPLMVLGAIGFEPLGGCKCGCGIPCDTQQEMPYARWVCEDDVGYSCTGLMESSLIFSSEPDAPPCATQSASVLWMINLFMMGVPGVLGLLAAYFAFQQVITVTMQQRIRALITEREKGLGGTGAPVVVDPVTGRLLVLPSNTPTELMFEHWSAAEMERVQAGGVGRLRQLITLRLVGWLTLLAAVVGAMAATRIEYIVTLGCLVLAVLFVLIPWDAKRLHVLLSDAAAPLSDHASLSSYLATSDTSSASSSNISDLRQPGSVHLSAEPSHAASPASAAHPSEISGEGVEMGVATPVPSPPRPQVSNPLI